MHESIRLALNACLDGELDAIRQQEVEQHLADCEACRNEYAQLSRLVALLRAAPAPAFPQAEHFASHLLRRLPARPQAFPARRRFLTPTAWLAPCALLTLWLVLHLAIIAGNLFGVAEGIGLTSLGVPALRPDEATFWSVVGHFLSRWLSAPAQSLLAVFYTFNLWYHHLWQNFASQASIALLYWLWVGWLLRRNRVIAHVVSAA
jgi:hypothetical protein